MAIQLTQNSVTRMVSGNCNLDDYHPIVQINAVKSCAGAGNEKHKLLVSDGSHFTTVLSVGSSIHKMIEEGEVTKYTVVKVDRSSTTQANGKNLLLFLDISVVAQATDKIGNPLRIDDTNTPQTNTNNPPPVKSNTSHTTSLSNTGGLAGAAPGGAPGTVFPISSLNPYQNKWTVRARVTKKSDIRTWSNARGEGKLFSIELMDDSGEIRCTGFTEACDKFFNLVEQDKVYYISRCVLKTANKQYTAIKNDYEMTMTNDTTIVPCEDMSLVPEVKLNYTNIAELERIENGGFADVIGIATQINEVSTITAKATGKQVVKRELTIQDKSGASTRLTLWGADAESFDGTMANPVISIKAAKVSDFGGRSISVSFSSTLQVNPDNPVSHELRGWYETVGKDQAVRQMSSSQGGASMETPFKTFQEVKSANMQDKPEYFSSSGTVVFVKKDNCMYQACPSSDCNKKVIQESTSEYRCEKCDKLYPDFEYRLMLTVKLADFTGSDWVTTFNDTAESLLGVKAAELGNLKENNEAEFERVMNRINFTTHHFKLRARLESYMDESRMKCTALSIQDADHIAQCKRLLDDIRTLEC